jgi:hypothetical protein
MKRYFPYLAVLVLLVGLNFVHWAAPQSVSDSSGSRHDSFTVADYQVRVSPSAAQESERPRDLFFGAVAAPAAHHPVASRARPIQPPEPPPKTAEELQEEAARAELAVLKVTGIAFRGGKGQAYITAGEESYVVKAGDRIADRFDVLEITSEYVSLKDPATSVGAKVPLQGE